MEILMPFIIIAFMAWGIAEDYMNDSVIWKLIYYVVGFVCLIFGVTLLRALV